VRELDQELGRRIIALSHRVVANFDFDNWNEVGLLTGLSDLIDSYPRLLRSLSFSDEDYAGNVLGVLKRIAQRDMDAFRAFERYVDDAFPGDAEYVSAKPAERRITFAPNVFSVPEALPEDDLVAVMMPFHAEFNPVHKAIRASCADARLRCQRVDDIWEDSVIVQDVFSLIFRAQVVIVDFTAKNPNVMYETGIAHTLGKHVVPITQSMDDVPFDLHHHRVLKYFPNTEGLAVLMSALAGRLRQVAPRPDPAGDDIPF
jgi:nucleoside 2-deoxyribosyltransferase